MSSRQSVRMGFGRKRKGWRVSQQMAAGKLVRQAQVEAARAIVSPLMPASRGLVVGPGEFKSVDVVDQTIAVDVATGVYLLNGIARGDEINQRNGREVIMRSIQFQYTTRATTATGLAQQHRIMLVYDRQTNATPLTAAQVLTSASTLAPRNLENRKRFKILYDRTFAINPSTESDSEISRRFYRRLRHPITFNGNNAGTVGDITTGSLYLVVVGTIPVGSTAGSITFCSRVRYQDQ